MTAPTPPEPPKAQTYITIIKGRRPKQKAHVGRGPAINALKFHMVQDSTMWRLRDGEWALVATADLVKVEHPRYDWLETKVDVRWEEGEAP